MAKKSNGFWYLIAGAVGLALVWSKTAKAGAHEFIDFKFDPQHPVETYRQYFTRHGITSLGVNGNYDGAAKAGILDHMLNADPNIIYIGTDNL